MNPAKKAIETVSSAAGDRLRGDRPSPIRAAAAAAVAGVTTGAVVYRLLRQ